MKQSAFSRPPCRLIWYALVPLSLIFAFCFFLNGAIADEEPSLWETVVVSNPNPQDRLNLREQPSEAAASLGKYYNGVVVQIDQNLQNGWVHVTIGNGEGIAQGYMSTQYLAFGQDAQTVASAIPQYQSTSSQWSLRALPNDFGTELPIRYASGVQVELLGFTDEWWHMRVGDCTGYIRHNPAAFKQLSGYYYDGYRIGIVNNANPSARLNLRKEPKTSASSLGKYYNGCVVALLSDQSNGWIRVRIGNLEGYMKARYLLLNAGINSVASAMPTVTIRNSSGTGLNLRENPSKNSTILGLYSNGTSVQVLGLSENWYHVQVDGKTGFMISSGFSDRLSYSSSNTGNSSNNTGNSSKENTVWNGPSGTHKTAEWPLIIDDYLAVVNNPKSTDRLHLRSSASEKATSLGKYYNGVRVIVDGPVDGEWTKVIVGNLNGYMKTKYLVISGEGKPYPSSAMPIMTINNPNSEQCVDLYAEQSQKSEFLGVYYNGTSVILMGFNATWAHVIVDGKVGFILAKYLE